MGGGSGGHVTPVAAVCRELLKSDPTLEIRFWCDQKFYQQAFTTMVSVDGQIKVETIIAGKLRRYHKLSLVRQLLQFRTIVLPNVVDALKLLAGTVQSIVKLLIWRPDVVFSKGGFVCLPVGIAAGLLRIPLVIHDSDAHPGLTSRILARWAKTIATGAPLKHYSYPKDRSHYIGIPVASLSKPVSQLKQRESKIKLGFDEHEPLVVITGGGLGAESLNNATSKVIDDLLALTSVALVAGKDNVETLAQSVGKRRGLQIHGYVPGEVMQSMLSAADVVVSRAGATTLLELAALAKPSIIVPNENLTGGHQLKNAAVYQQAKAVVILDDAMIKKNPLALVDTVSAVLLNKKQMKQLSENIRKFARPSAAKDMAELIRQAAR